MRRTPRLLAATLLAVLVLTGCTTPASPPPPPPPPEPTPVFASDEEALAAAEKAYAAYIATVDAILRDGGSSPERLRPLVSMEVYERESRGFEEFANQGWRGTGATSFHLSLQRYDNAEVTAYVCEDISATDVINREGHSIVTPDRATLYEFQVTFAADDALVLTSKDAWEGGGVCAV